MTPSLSARLTLREGADARSRSARLTHTLIEHLPGHRPLRALDLATGTGANIRYLAPLLPEPHQWRAVDRDASVLEQVPPHVDTHCAELGTLDDPTVFAGQHLVTASALLDLVSDEWLERLAIETAARRLPVYAALSYDGRIEMTPKDTADAAIIDAVNRHQRTDKGFGPALGPDAARAAVARFEHVGYSVVHGAADWLFGPRDREIQLEMLTGWAAAAREIGGVAPTEIIAWLTRRREIVASGRSTIRVGHVDFFAFAGPSGSR